MGIEASLAKRIAKTIVAKFPGMEIHALPDPLAGNSDALLKFNAACRRKEAGAPDGFYVTEAVLYKSSVVLFYWTDNGDPAWRHLPRECFGQAMISPVCQSRFRTADIAFTEVFTSSLAKAHGAP